MSKLPQVGTTIFTVMSQLANEYGAINLSQGFPNFPVDVKLTDILRSISSENVHQYAPMAGNSALLEQIAELTKRVYKRDVNPSKEILITAGATQAIFTVLQAFVYAGEEVIVLDPSYDCYEPSILLCGAKAVRIPLNQDFSPNWDLIESKINSKTKILIINNPHNPSGTVWDESDILRLEEIMEKNPSLLLLSDEVYEFITFEKNHISINTREKIRERSLIISSFGKTFHITGWKIGYLLAPEKLMIEIKKVHQFLVFSVNSVAQVALSKYLSEVDVLDLGKFYQEKRNHFKGLMKTSRFRFLPSEGTYFQLASYDSISSESDTEFCKTLVKEHGVATIPLSVFNSDQRDDKLIRFCFAKDESTLIQAAEKLCRI